MKAIGKGLAQPLDSFAFTLDPVRQRTGRRSRTLVSPPLPANTRPSDGARTASPKTT
ncbi:hypothetical protein [Rhizobium lusitanum]|uniref:hypothetical protein n=1 Tax=Rhizobium lusitanum TaxID=293958 RepID=UPI0025739B29|nr:hypothetical protein [Rhizobium lusitanum]